MHGEIHQARRAPGDLQKALSEYDRLFTMLQELAGSDTLVIPSVGPMFGTMMDQAAIGVPPDVPTATNRPAAQVTSSNLPPMGTPCQLIPSGEY